MKKETEEKREEREAAWAEAEMTEAEKKEKAKKKAKKEAEEAKKLKEQGEIDLSSYGYAADDNPDNPDNYQAPEDNGQPINVFGNMVPKSSDMREISEGALKAPGDEDKEEEAEVNVVHSEGNTRMVVFNDKKDGDEDFTETGPEQMQRLEE